MSTLRTRSTAIIAAAALMLAVCGCSTSPGASSPGPSSSDAPAPTSTTDQVLGSRSPAEPAGEVIGTGTVLDEDGAVKLCMGAIMESYPPQCVGIPLKDWSWDGVDGSEASAQTRWGAYAVTGTFDGTAFTLTQPPVMLALYDPMMPADPTDGVDGTTDQAELDRILGQIGDRFDADLRLLLGTRPDRGYVWVDVVWDDGTLQADADTEFGPGVVIVRSALRAIG